MIISIDVINDITIIELNDANDNPVTYTAPQTVILTDFYDENEIGTATSLQTAIDNSDANLFIDGNPSNDLDDINSVGAVESVTGSAVDNTDPLNPIVDLASNGFTIFSIWAEENGALSNNNRQWSFGNGSTGAVNLTIPIDCEIFAMSLEAEVGGTNVSIELMQGNTPVTSQLFNGASDFVILNTPISVSSGDRIGFRTDVETGSYVDVRVSAWFRVRSNPSSTSILNDLLDVSIGNISAGQILQYDGSNFIPLTLDSNAVGLGNVDNTSDVNKPISTATQVALDQKLESSDIANFETSTELDARDAANRNRVNHTGTQTASTISDFAAAVQAAQYAGSLSLSANTLTFNDGNGNITPLDLSIYLDDTNLARITGGTLNSTTGIATFTRDDASTFTVDFSALNDQAFINAAIAAHEAASDPHSQYQTAIEVQAQIEVHSLNNNNPHNVNLQQAGMSLVKAVNAAVTGNLNTGIAILTGLSTTDNLGLNDSDFTILTNGIQCNFDGVVHPFFNCELSGAVTRAVVGFRWLRGTDNGPWVRHTYIRNGSGHTESSGNFSSLITVSNGDIIQVQHDDFAGAGTVISPANGIEFGLIRVR